MGLFSFSKTAAGRTFSLSLAIFTVYSLTTVLRGLSVIGIQMPIIIVCFILLLSSCGSNNKRGNSLSRVLTVAFIFVVFDFVFFYTQAAAAFQSMSLQNAIGFNYSVFVSFFPVLYVVSGNLEYIDRRKFINFVYLIAAVTAITTIGGTFIYESPCRELATPDNVEIDRLYKSQNIGGDGFIYFLVLITPILIRDIFHNRSVLKIALLLVFGICILRSEYTTALLLYIVGASITFLLSAKSKIIKLVAVVAIIIFIGSLQDILNFASTSLSDTSYMMSKRFEMMTDYNQYGEADDDLGIRIMLYMQSLKAFLNNPAFGNLISFSPIPLGGHSLLLDFIGHSGLLGIVSLFTLIRFLRRRTPFYRINLKDPFIKATMIVALIIALINTFMSPELYYAILIMPLLADYSSRVIRAY